MPTDETTDRLAAVPAAGDTVVMHEERDPRTDTIVARVENALNLLVLLVLGIVPILEIGVRTLFRAGIPDAIDLVQNTVLLVGFVGGMLAAREGQHLSVSASSVLSGNAQRVVDAIANLIAVAFTAAFAVSAVEWWITAFGRGSTVWFVPIRFFAA
ncbi:MAG: TRAP transporter small permease subunit, partial [Spirochaetaceae bacterium]